MCADKVECTIQRASMRETKKTLSKFYRIPMIFVFNFACAETAITVTSFATDVINELRNVIRNGLTGQRNRINTKLPRIHFQKAF